MINARNRLQLAKLTLAQLLSIESAEEFDIVKPNFDQLELILPPYNAKDLFTVAVERQPGILGAEYRSKSSERGLKAARGGYYPTLSVFGGNRYGLLGIIKNRYWQHDSTAKFWLISGTAHCNRCGGAYL